MAAQIHAVPVLPPALDELKARPQWVCWKIGKGRNGKLTKLPFNPITGRPADSTNPADWGTYEQAQAALAKGGYQGIGYVFSADDPYTGVDLDKCINPETGEVEPWAARIVEDVDSYTELSPSGTGFHIIVKGTLPPEGRRKSRLEMYDSGRYFTVTGEHWAGTPAAIEARQTALDELHHRTFSKPQPQPKRPAGTGTVLHLDDRALIDKATSARNGAAFRLLWEGDTSAHGGDHSAADLALCSHLAFWTNGDRERMDRLFRQSGLYREKWDKRRGDRTYGERTLDEALQSQREGYTGTGSGRRRGSDASREEPPAGPPARPEIRWIGGELPAAVQQAEQALIANMGDEPIFQRGGLLVRVVRRGTVDVKGIRKAAGSLAVVPVELPYLVRRFTQAANFVRWNERAQGWKAMNCPDLVAKTYLAMVGEWQVPILTAIIEAPTLRPDGSVLDRPGYDPETGLLFDPGVTRFEPIPQTPSRDDALKALEELDRLLAGFPFAAPHDKSVLQSAILTGLDRRSMKSAPLYGFAAPKMGSGKTLAADLVALIATGRSAVVMTHNPDPAEEKKRLLSILMEGDPVVCIDNVETPLGSEALCSILTQSAYKDRLLGVNRTVEVSTCATWLATGNNLCVVGDLSTRVLLCTLDPQCERPEERDFSVNLYEHIPAHRGALVRAGLTILRAYHCAGRPRQNIKPFGRFEEWSDLIRSALVWLGLDDPCKSRQGLEAADPVRTQLRAVLSAWHGCKDLGHHTVKVREIIDAAENCQDLQEALLDVAGTRDGRINARRFGNWLAKYERRIESGFRIESMGSMQGVALWRVVALDSGGFGGFGGFGLRPRGNFAEMDTAKNIGELDENQRNPPNQRPAGERERFEV